jgi:hypothetical protein
LTTGSYPNPLGSLVAAIGIVVFSFAFALLANPIAEPVFVIRLGAKYEDTHLIMLAELSRGSAVGSSFGVVDSLASFSPAE